MERSADVGVTAPITETTYGDVMPMPEGVTRIKNGEYEYKGWKIRQLTNFRWRGIKSAESVTQGTLKEVCSVIKTMEDYRATRERNSI